MAGVAFFVLLDQITKHYAVKFVSPYNPLEVASFLQLVNWRNEGAAFGMFKAFGNIGFIAITFVAVGFVTYMLIAGLESRFGLMLILSGALGNLIDRVRFGYVRDFIYFAKGGFSWPAFNVADSCLTVGVALLILIPLVESRLKRPRPEDAGGARNVS